MSETTTPTAPAAEPATPPTDPKPDATAELSQKLADLEAQLTRAQNALLDPSYQEYLAAKVAGKLEARAARSAAKEPPELSKLTPEEFAEVVEQRILAKVAPRMDQVDQQAQLQAAVAQVKECREKYADFDDYREVMLRIVQEMPTITAERAYKLAKAEHPEVGTAAASKRAKAAQVEVPTTVTSRIVREPADKGLKPAFSLAWRKAFGNANTAE